MLYIVELSRTHPTGSFRRAGHTFGYEPRTVDLEGEALVAVASDPYLVCTPVSEASYVPAPVEVAVEPDASGTVIEPPNTYAVPTVGDAVETKTPVKRPSRSRDPFRH